MRKIIAAAALLTALSATAGPFGMSKGMTLGDLKKQGAFEPGDQKFVYMAKSIIKGHPDFESYVAVLTPEQGLCRIVAAGNNIDTSSFGTELIDKHKNLVEAISEKYGAPRKNFNFVRAESIWKEPQDWMMGLLKKERFLTTIWGNSGNNILPDMISSIMVEAVPVSSSTGYVKISYEFDNIEACKAVIQNKRNSNL